MARSDAGLTISELAERAGVARDTISKAEKGQHSLQASTLHKIARALGKAPSELLAEEERLAPKAPRRSPSEPSFNDVLAQEERHAELEEIRDLYRESREGLDRYCTYWERRVVDDDLDRQSVREFLVAAGAWVPTLDELLMSELLQIAAVLGIEEGSGITGEMQAESLMYPARRRYYDIGRRLQKVWEERFATAETAEATGAPVIDFEAARQELLTRRTG